MAHKNILVIDDNLDLLESLVDIITLKDFEVTTAMTLFSAKEELDRSRPDLIICDINLPDGNGIDFIKAIKSSQEGRDTPCMLITGDLDRATFRRSMLNGADDYITKPFSPAEILESIEYLLDSNSRRIELISRVNRKLQEVNHINSHELRHSVSSLQGLLALIQSDDIDISECNTFFDTINQELEDGIQHLNHVLNND